MNATERVVTRAIAEEARAWFITNRVQGLSDEHRQEFLTWLQTSPLHVREYLAAAKLAIDVKTAANLIEESTEELIAAALDDRDDDTVTTLTGHSSARTKTKRSKTERARTERAKTELEGEAHGRNRVIPQFRAMAAGFATLAIAVLSWWSLTQLPSHKEYRTAHGEQRTVRLEDGSVLHINSDSILLVDYTKGERGVSMERGQALFKVAKDKTRPFRVRAGATEVVAVGTEFDVRRVSNEVQVTVVEGAVAVTAAEINTTELMSSVPSPSPLRLAAGQQVRVTSNRPKQIATPKPADVHAVDVRPAVAWVQQKIMFESDTLQNVAAEFNRYGTTQLVIEDSQAAALRISGIFNAYDLESFVLYLETLKGLEVHRDTNQIRISLVRNNGETT